MDTGYSFTRADLELERDLERELELGEDRSFFVLTIEVRGRRLAFTGPLDITLDVARKYARHYRDDSKGYKECGLKLERWHGRERRDDAEYDATRYEELVSYDGPTHH